MGEKRDLDSLLSLITEMGTKALECDRVSIFLLDPESQTIWSKVAMGTGEKIIFAEGTGIAGECIAKSMIINIPSAYEDSRFNPDIDHKTGYYTRTLLAVPMKNNSGQTIGCFQALNKVDAKPFEDDDANFAMAFCSQAAVAIESALLHDENMRMILELLDAKRRLQEKIRQIETIHEIESQSHRSSNISEFFAFTCRSIANALNAATVSILIEWDHGKWLHFFLDLSNKNDMAPLCETIIETSSELEQAIQAIESIRLSQSDSLCALEFLDGSLELDIATRTLIPLSFSKVTQEGKILTRKALIQLMYQRDHQPVDESKSFLKIVGGNIASIIEQRLKSETEQQSNRLATIGQLSSTIFHDFKNPMASIRGIAELIGMGALTAEKITHFTDIIQVQVDRCCGMIEELLAFTRGETNYNFQIASFGGFMKRIGEILTVEAERCKIHLELSCTVEHEFRFDADKLMRVIFNLTNNAFEILKPGDTINIASFINNDGFVEISITDTGPGVPSHLQDTLFEVFVTHGKKGGTGLGLNIARQIVRGHGGEIILDKAYRGGARFICTLSQNPSIAA